ncbi:MAG: AmmeMemoRadiSam system radical SAM enzyme [Gammaproteobacteria bacterium]
MSNAMHTVATEYWHPLGNGQLQCDLCPRYCKLREGQRGLCFVRQNLGGEMVLTTYGRSSGFCIDPIEKKPLNHFYPGSAVLSFGTAGCNLACKFCQNWDISKSREMDALTDQALPQQIAAAAAAHGCRSVAYTYNDPVIFLEYAVGVAQACRDREIKNVAVTAGYICDQPRERFFRQMDAANVDLKSFNDEFYFKSTGAHLAPVLETLQYLRRETSVWLELTTLLIPGMNDSAAELEKMTQWVYEELGAEVPWHFTAFHPDYKLLDRQPTPLVTLQRARAIARKAGMRYVYTGNVMDDEGGSTYCHQCDELLTARHGYQLHGWDLNDAGRCKFCAAPCAGHFDAVAGVWGARRQPVRIADFSAA